MKHDRVGEGVAKTATATITSVKNEGLGSFEALVAVFGNIDSQGDMVTKGAFADALATKAVWPSVWAHQMHDDTAIIGTGAAKETDDGLIFTADFLDTPRAQNIRKLMEAGVITEFSWSGRVTEGSWVDKEGVGPWGDGYYEIRKVDLWEAGPCFKGANPDTELLGVKSAVSRLATKEGRVLAQKHVTTLKTIHEELAEVIAAVEKIDDDEEEKSSTELPDDPSGTESASEPSGALRISPQLKARLALA